MAGLELQYWDIFSNLHLASAEAKRAILGALGIAAEDDDAAEASLFELEEQPWRRPLPPVLVVAEGERPSVLLALAQQFSEGELDFEIVEEDGAQHRFTVDPAKLPRQGTRRVGEVVVERRVLAVPLSLPMGYHELSSPTLECRPMRLIVVPARCYLPRSLAAGGKQWGLSAHVYALRSPTDWGIGDLSGLERLVEAAGELGASSVGVNPLHALFHQQPRRASPYSPSSRLFLNPLYLDVEAVPDYSQCPRARRNVDARRDEIDVLRRERLVDYARVTELKLAVLGEVFACYAQRTPLDGQGEFDDEAFRRFRESQGTERLRRFAVFEALSEHFEGRPWRQ